jgi:hypothetical protein
MPGIFRSGGAYRVAGVGGRLAKWETWLTAAADKELKLQPPFPEVGRRASPCLTGDARRLTFGVHGSMAYHS